MNRIWRVDLIDRDIPVSKRTRTSVASQRILRKLILILMYATYTHTHTLMPKLKQMRIRKVVYI